MGRKKKAVDESNYQDVFAYITRMERESLARKGLDSKSDLFKQACLDTKFSKLYSSLQESVVYQKSSMVKSDKMLIEFIIEYVSSHMEDLDTIKMWTSLRKKHSNHSYQITLQNTDSLSFNRAVKSLMDTFNLGAEGYTQSDIVQSCIKTLDSIGSGSDVNHSGQFKKYLDDHKFSAYLKSNSFEEAKNKCIAVLIQKGLDAEHANAFLCTHFIKDINNDCYALMRFIEQKQHDAVLKVLNEFGEMLKVKTHALDDNLKQWFKEDAPSLSLEFLDGFNTTNIKGFNRKNRNEIPFQYRRLEYVLSLPETPS